ncbi:MAG: BrnA antitoxin family protein [Acidobacteriaceae bacterium]
MPGGKTSVHLRLDSDVVEWFKANGKGHLTRMNAVLRAYVEAQKHSPSRT